MKGIVLLCLLAPALSHATLMEWIGTGPQTYYWDDQANPTAQITIRADESKIHSVAVTNTRTTFSFLNPDVDFFWSESQKMWGGEILARGFEPEQYPGSPDTLLNTLIGWRIHAPSQDSNPLTMLDNVYYVGVGTDTFQEFKFEPTRWTERCLSDCDTGEKVYDVPEPASLALVASGLLGMLLGRRRMPR